MNTALGTAGSPAAQPRPPAVNFASGSEDSRFYFVGMEMAGALASARGARYFEALFVRPPTRFVGDYFELCKADSSLPRFAAGTRRVIGHLPASW